MSEHLLPPGHEVYYSNGGWRYTDEKTTITANHVGRYAKLTRGYASGLIGVIERNASALPLAPPYNHVTKSGIASGIRYLSDVELLD